MNQLNNSFLKILRHQCSKKLLRNFSVSGKLFTSQTGQELIQVSNHNSIKTITLNNSAKRNALSLNVLSLLNKELQSVNHSETSAIIINANGPVFSSGHNLREFLSSEGIEVHKDILHNCSEVMNRICDLPIPVIAAVQGLATAAGCQLVASCDLAVVAESTLFATPGVKIGLFCTTPGVAVGRAVPKKIAMQMLLTGEPLTAQQALTYGLVNYVVPDNSVETESIKLAESIAKYSRSVIALGKKSFNEQMTMPRVAAYEYAGRVMVENLKMKDCQEGISSFVNKRKPQWTHSEEKIH